MFIIFLEKGITMYFVPVKVYNIEDAADIQNLVSALDEKGIEIRHIVDGSNVIIEALATDKNELDIHWELGMNS